MQERRVLIDFDNTFHLPGCDVDDALALLYLLGCDGVRIEGICTTYGNSTLDAVHADTERLLDTWGVAAPLHRGAPAPLREQASPSPAARAIVEALEAAPGQIDILATGSTTNLGAAERIAPGTLARARSITLMGGVTESLAINGRIMDELNLSCDAAATLAVLGSGARTAIATSQNCLPAFFTRTDMQEALAAGTPEWDACEAWFKTMDAQYGWMGWTCWDVVAAAYLVHPELFEADMRAVTLYERFLAVGYLECDHASAPSSPVNLPRIQDPDAFNRHVLSAWQRGIERTRERSGASA